MRLIHFAAAALGALTASLAFAQAYPTKTVSLVVPFPRAAAPTSWRAWWREKLRESLKANVVVDNKPGASAQIGTKYVVDAAPDGHTLLVGTTSLVNGPALFGSKLPYDAQQAAAPGHQPGGPADLPLGQRAKVQRQDGEGVRRAGEEDPEPQLGSAGPGTTLHMSGEWFKAATGVQSLHVPFKGSARKWWRSAGGEVDFAMENLRRGAAHGADGAACALLAVASHSRHPQAPDVPTFKEAGPARREPLHLDLPDGAGGDARRGGGAAQQHHQRHPQAPRTCRTSCCSRASCSPAARWRDGRAHEGRGRALGQGDPQRQHHAGSTGTLVSELVKYKKNGQIVTITLDNPPVNAVSTKVLKALNAAFDRAEQEDDARVIIFAGEGAKAFCAGGDMREEKDFGDPETARAFRTLGRDTLNRIENGKLPVIAAIHGYCIGGGTALGWVCDIRVAAENSVFRAGDAYLGMLPSWGMGLTRLPRYVGRNKALDILLHRRELRRQGSLRDGPHHQDRAARQAHGRVHRDRQAHLQSLAHRHPRHPPGRRRQPAPQLGRHGEAGSRAVRNDVRPPGCA